ncbi:MAG: AraC family transcriptional regulator [Nannocystaceae bacterium]|nr:AraC family transcriptional regulator [Nannocystaceae bacterium]
MARLNLGAAFYGGRGFSLYHATGSHSRVPLSPHFHDEYLISAQISGNESCHVAGTLHQFNAGDVALINPQQVHTGNTEGDDIEYVSLYVDRTVVNALANDRAAPTTQPEFTRVKAAGHTALVRAMTHLLALVRHADKHTAPTRGTKLKTPSEPTVAVTAAAAAVPHNAAHELEIESALHNVVSMAFDEFSNLRAPQLRSTSRVGHRKVARALEYMRGLAPGARADEVSPDDLAHVAGLSKYHFLRQFSSVVGITPGAYLRTLRLCHAARLLRSSEKPIVEVATAVGFADHPSFSRAFGRHMGLTPSEYRRLGPL